MSKSPGRIGALAKWQYGHFRRQNGKWTYSPAFSVFTVLLYLR